MRFYCVTRDFLSNSTTIKLLEVACKKQAIEFVLIESKDYDFSHPIDMKKNSILYNLSDDERSLRLFKSLVRDDIATVFRDSFSAISFADSAINSAIIHQKAGIPVIKSIFDLTRDKTILKNYVKYLGGFPVIIKAEGGSHGVGIIKIDSLESLSSIADYLIKKETGSFMLRQYIDYKDHARLIVLGEKVIDSVKYHRVEEDFRSNVGKKIRIQPKKFGNEVNEIAIAAVKALNADFGGVDILIDKHGKSYLAEVNVTCYFPHTQLSTGNDSATQLLKYLQQKAAAL